MKKIIFILFALFVFSCDDDSEPIIQNKANKVILLKVDFLTNQFEGGKEFEFSTSESFTISSTYNTPVDFGDIQLYYNELNEKILTGQLFGLEEVKCLIQQK